ncbi:MAG: zinc ribbon domain-containing protein [Pirellulaceae bacterium]|nr:zinc ribbon domain-containing protein [Pirellulaceae bacterium]
MQCSNCHFENLPGATTCGRCGASLQLASLAIDVHPPRASRESKQLRKLLPVARWQKWFALAGWQQQISTFHAYLKRVGFRLRTFLKSISWRDNVPKLRLVMRTIIPGWAHWYSGRHIRAKWIFGGYVFFLLMALLLNRFPTVNYILLIQAIAVFHAASAADALVEKEQYSGQRLLYFALAWFLLSSFVYVYYSPISVVRLLGW